MGVDFSLPFHVQINKPKKASLKNRLKLNPAITRQFRNRGLRLTGGEFKSLMAGRTLGINTLDRILAKTPITMDMSPDKRKGLAIDLADMLMDSSLEAQLSREAPTALDLNRQREEQMQYVMLGTVVKDFPLQAKLTIHLPIDWL